VLCKSSANRRRDLEEPRALPIDLKSSYHFMQKFKLELNNEKVKSYDRFAIFIFLLNAAAIAGTIYAIYGNTGNNKFGFIGMIVLLLAILIYIFNPLKKNKPFVFLSAAIGIFLYWTFTGYWWVGFIMLSLFGLYLVSKRKLIVSLEPDKIIYPTFPKRIIAWDELNNVILKDGLLTIDFKNDKLIQASIINTETNEKDFNDFCNLQLKQKAVD
jgi:hypothetical protein